MATCYHNGIIRTLNEEEQVEALIENNGIIELTGTGQQAEQWKKDHPEVHVSDRDLQGKTLMPSFIDPHSHITALAQTVDLLHLDGVTSIDELLQRIRDFIKANDLPAGTVVQGFGYDHNFLKEHRHPTRQELDSVSPDHPVLIAHASGHMGVVSSAILKNLGIDENTPDPEGGMIGREPGTTIPNGYLEENAFLGMNKGRQAPAMDQMLDKMEKAQKVYLRYGITTVQDGVTKKPDWMMLQAMAEQDKLKVDVVSYPDLKDNLEIVTDHPAYSQYNHHLRIGGGKLILDGSPQGKTAWMSRPYEGDPEYCGYPVYQDEQLQALIEKGLKNGLQILTHCNGDAASEQWIRCYERELKKYPEMIDTRPVMIHCQTVRRDQIARMKELNMTASFFTAHTYHWGDIHLKNFGKERGGNVSPMKWAVEEGIPYTMHQDTPVLMPDMFESLWCACVRKTKMGQQLNTDLCITPLQALKAVTINAAWQYHEEDRKGTLEKGKLADMIIVDKDPLNVDTDELRTIRVLETIKEGKSVYTA